MIVVVTKPLPLTEKRLMSRLQPAASASTTAPQSFLQCLGYFLTPQVWKQAQQAAPRLPLAEPAVSLGLAVHDLVRRRLLARTFRDGPRLLRRLASTAPPSGQELRRLREGARESPRRPAAGRGG